MKKIKVRSFFKKAWDIFKKNFGIIVAAGLVVTAIGGIQQSLFVFSAPAEGEMPGLGYFISLLISTVISLVLSMGTIRFFLKLVDEKKARIEDIFQGVQSPKHILKFFVVGMIVGLFTSLGLVILIVPGIIVAIGLAFHKFTAYENTMTIWDTVVYNWELTKGYRWKIFLFYLFAGLLVIGGFFLLIVGVFIAIPVIWIATALMYRELQSIKGSNLEEVLAFNSQEKKALIEEK